MKARTDQARTVIIGEARSPVGVSLGLRLIGDEEVAAITLTQHDQAVILHCADQAHAARIAAAIQGRQPLAAEAPRVEAKATSMADCQLVPFPPTPEMVSAAAEAYMPFGDMELALRMAILAAPAVQGEPVGEVRFELGAPSSIFAELYSKSLPVLAPGTKLYAAPQPAEQQPFEWPRLDRPAKVGAGRFGKGVSSRLVIEAAQRQYEYDVTPEKEAERIAKFADFRKEVLQPVLAAAGLVEALEAIVSHHDEYFGDSSAESKMPWIEQARSALATYRKGGAE
ncbi:hypothetical protein SAMN05216578_102285 [Halopseudomonas formosensis]|uniref:Uncharacterized protein n=1 Tax=Halopseudomonas formosensis TaxID=1002526 RepID=A0A1I6APD4_9GAMM|nr:hypothetical protein [Halopseudomonas formosensis]SFQ70506.1 hypothetical protein SAMN05216578_102285 [Halopseudomonas formosensis]